MAKWYVEFHGPEPMQEIGSSVDATDPDDAIEKARALVREDWDNPPEEETEPLGGGEPLYTFDAWKVVRCVRMVE